MELRRFALHAYRLLDGTVGFLPTCAVCLKLIEDFRNANVEWTPDDATDSGSESQPLNCRVFAVHKGCAEGLQRRVGHTCWISLHYVVRSDQRGLWDRCVDGDSVDPDNPLESEVAHG